jgi:hypothetical protein
VQSNRQSEDYQQADVASSFVIQITHSWQ